MNLEIEKISTAKDLPQNWDLCAVDYFQKREFLFYTEKYNPCQQRYYLLKREGTFCAGLIVYSLHLDLLTFLPISTKIRMNISGIPCSVSASGYIGEVEDLAEFLLLLAKDEKGLHLFLNHDKKPEIDGMATGRTLPSIVLENTFSSFEDYIHSINASYRRRHRIIAGKFKNIHIKTGPCSAFSKEMYDQYLAVLKRSKGKLETLSPEFFKNLPDNFQLSHFYDSKKLIGWDITIKDENTFYYFLGGIDYALNSSYNTYFNILFHILKQGIESGATWIDFGQTAEIPKMRLGGKVAEKFMLARHSNTFLRKLLIAGRTLLEYSTSFPNAHVLKNKR